MPVRYHSNQDSDEQDEESLTKVLYSNFMLTAVISLNYFPFLALWLGRCRVRIPLVGGLNPRPRIYCSEQ